MASITPILNESEKGFYIISRESHLFHFNGELAKLCEGARNFIFPDQPHHNTVPVLTLPYSFSSESCEYFRLLLFYRYNGSGVVEFGPASGYLYQEILSLKLLLLDDGIVQVAVRNF